VLSYGGDVYVLYKSRLSPGSVRTAWDIEAGPTEYT
jgi:hypothetical protein